MPAPKVRTIWPRCDRSRICRCSWLLKPFSGTTPYILASAALISGNQILGIYVGYRSSDPKKAQAFSERHYNFAISVEGPFRRALLAAAKR